MVTPDGAQWAPRPRGDNAMVKALARAFRWRKMLDEGGEEQGVQLTTYVSPAQSAASTLLVTKVGWTRSRNPRRSRPFGLDRAPRRQSCGVHLGHLERPGVRHSRPDRALLADRGRLKVPKRQAGERVLR